MPPFLTDLRKKALAPSAVHGMYVQVNIILKANTNSKYLLLMRNLRRCDIYN